MNKSKLYDWIAGILSVAIMGLFGLLLNIGTYKHIIDSNTKRIDKNAINIRKVETEFNHEIRLLREERNRGNLEVIKAIDQLKIELQNKKNRDN